MTFCFAEKFQSNKRKIFFTLIYFIYYNNFKWLLTKVSICIANEASIISFTLRKTCSLLKQASLVLPRLLSVLLVLLQESQRLLTLCTVFVLQLVLCRICIHSNMHIKSSRQNFHASGTFHLQKFSHRNILCKNISTV